MTSDSEVEPRAAAHDRVADTLQAMRKREGSPSYAVVVSRIGEARATRTPPAHAPARSTVYDAFRHGRQRIDTGLVLEIARALDADSLELETLRELCASGNIKSPPPARTSERPSQRAQHDAKFRRASIRWQVICAVIFFCVAVNVLSHGTVAWLGLPLFMDMVGTATAALVLGPWWGVLVALATNLLAMPLNSVDAAPFAFVNAAGALIWGYGARKFDMARTVGRYFVLNLAVAVGCTAVAFPILMFVFAGHTGHSSESLGQTLSSLGVATAFSVLIANLVTSVADKLVTGFAALALASFMLSTVARSNGYTAPQFSLPPFTNKL